ncbi:unnamed protein product [Adineta steineri]|uniref:OTU domain-containing protein n=1 Tax=Adineta steineri TaxID=433720 RepID=A0A815A040_9BILA|nr:unnamed protein product [Adineta steineri]CAF1248622.1 unnamed protein product [Adineta steineri]
MKNETNDKLSTVSIENPVSSVYQQQQVPADNSCLFTTLNFIINNGNFDVENAHDTNIRLRNDLACMIENDPVTYTDVVLERPRDEYIQWIQQPNSWGGNIEIGLFATFHGIEVRVLDVINSRIIPIGPTDAIYCAYVAYNGTHYEPLYSQNPSGQNRTTRFLRDNNLSNIDQQMINQFCQSSGTSKNNLMESDEVIERQAIGRLEGLGSLYDIRTDQFVLGNLFEKELPVSFLKCYDCANVRYWLDFHNSEKETLDKLNIEADLKLSLMAGLVHVGESAKYLTQTKRNSHTVRGTFIYQIKTKREHLSLSMEKLCEYFSSYAFQDSNATHAVVGITWGANVAATFEQIAENSDEKEQIEGMLKASFANVEIGIKGKADLNCNKQEKLDVTSLKIFFSGDALTNKCPQTIEGIMSVCEDVPNLIKSTNNGKGIQLIYTLCSLEQIAKIAKVKNNISRLIQDVSLKIINRLGNIFEQMNNQQKKLNDFFHDIKPWTKYIPRQWLDLIETKISNFNDEESELKGEISKLLVAIRSNKSEESEMIKLIRGFCNHSCSCIEIEKFLEKNKYIENKINNLKRISPNKNELLEKIHSIEDYIEDYIEDNDIYLLHICEEWVNQNKKNSLKQIKYFNNLKNNEKDNKNAKFWVIDYDLQSHLVKESTKSAICYYSRNGSIESRDVLKDSLCNLSTEQINLILKENPNLVERDLKNKFQEFINDYPDGELSKEDFIKELKKLFPKGDPKEFCKLAFKTIYKDNNDKINFSEFMTAVAITSSSDPEIRLHLIFSVLDYDHSKRIGVKYIGKFIETIQELNNGSSSVNIPKAESIAEQIMKICNKYPVTENEFIKCCKKNKEIARAFLPNLIKTEIKEIQIKKNQSQQFGITVAGGNKQGNDLNQLFHPCGIFIDNDKSIYIADSDNHRIVKWKFNSKTGQITAGGNGQGNENNQLNQPTDIIFDKKNNSFIISDHRNRRVIRYFFDKNQTNQEIIISNIKCYGLAIDKNGFIYVSDCENHDVRRWKKGDKEGELVAGGNGQGNHLNQLNYPTYIFIDENYSLYISDYYNHRVMKWKRDATEGIIVAGGNGEGNDLKRLSRPRGVIVDHLSQIYVADSHNHRVMRWCEGKEEGEIVVDGNGGRDELNQLNYPTGLSFDIEGNLYVVDCFNHRIQKVDIHSKFNLYRSLNKLTSQMSDYDVNIQEIQKSSLLKEQNQLTTSSNIGEANKSTGEFIDR